MKEISRAPSLTGALVAAYSDTVIVTVAARVLAPMEMVTPPMVTVTARAGLITSLMDAKGVPATVGMKVRVGVFVAVLVNEDVALGVSVSVGVLLKVLVRVLVGVLVPVLVGNKVKVPVAVGVAVGVRVGE
jgi:hypothetical protein